MMWASKRRSDVKSSPQEDVETAKSNSPVPEWGSVFSAWSGAFIVLLRITGLSVGPRWISFLYALTLLGLQSWFLLAIVYRSFEAFALLRNHGRGFFEALIDSGFLGIPNLTIWLTLSASLLHGGRKYPACLSRVSASLQEAKKVLEPAALPGRPNRTGEYVCGITAFIVLIKVAFLAYQIPILCSNGVMQCFHWLTYIGANDFSNICVQLVALKFAFSGHLIASGFHAMNSALEVIANGSHPVDLPDLQRIGDLQRQLSEAFFFLTSNMMAEVIGVMTFGVFLQITLVTYLTRLSALGFVIIGRVIIYIPGLLVTLVGPCEVCQLLLTRLGHSRDLLLQLERRRLPQLDAEVTLLQKSVARDLDTLGDLGLFHLRRSTLLSLFSTILTYIIVMVQFQQSEQGSSGEAISAINATNATEA